MLDDSEDYKPTVEKFFGVANEIPSEVPASLSNDLEATLRLFVGEYKSFTKQAAEHLIRKCATVAEAEATLPEETFERFLTAVGLDKKSSTFRKYRKIGDEADRLLAVADRLPDNWTTLYTLAKLEKQEFDTLVTSNSLHPGITASGLSSISSSGPTEERCVFRIDATPLPDCQRAGMFHDLEDMAEKYGVVVTGLPDELAASLDKEVA
jgi:hypothetical protein